MNVARSAGAALAAIASTAAWSAAAQDRLAQDLVLAASPQPFSSADLLWMEVRSGDQELTESMNVYASRGGVFVPLGEFSRVLDLAVGVFPAQRRAEGWVLSPSNRLVVDLDRQEARVEGKVIPFGDDQADVTPISHPAITRVLG